MSARKPSAVNVYLDLLGSRGGGSGRDADGMTSGRIEAVLRDPVERLSTLGELNFLLADGVRLIAYATRRLQLLEHPCQSEPCDEAAVFLAAEPLTAEEWTPLPLGIISS